MEKSKLKQLNKVYKMKIYNVNLFSGVYWKNMEIKIIVESKEKLMEYIERKYPKETRIQPYSDKEDSLEIELETEFDSYYVISETKGYEY